MIKYTKIGVLVGVLLFAPLAPVALAQTTTPIGAEVGGETLAPLGVATDTKVEGMELATTSVSLIYPVRARLFGVFPTTLSAEATVVSNGSVKLKYPWYGFFFATNQAEIQTKLEAVGKVVGAFASSTLTTQQQVTLLTLMHAALQSSLQGDAGTTGVVQ